MQQRFFQIFCLHFPTFDFFLPKKGIKLLLTEFRKLLCKSETKNFEQIAGCKKQKILYKMLVLRRFRKIYECFKSVLFSHFQDIGKRFG